MINLNRCYDCLGQWGQWITDKFDTTPPGVKEFLASVDTLSSEEKIHKCNLFILELFKETGFDPHAQITHMMDSEMQEQKQRDIEEFLTSYCSRVPEIMAAFRKQLKKDT